MRRWLAAGLSAIAALSFTACGGSEDESAAPTRAATTGAAASEPPGLSTVDKAAGEGLVQATFANIAVLQQAAECTADNAACAESALTAFDQWTVDWGPLIREARDVAVIEERCIQTAAKRLGFALDEYTSGADAIARGDFSVGADITVRASGQIYAAVDAFNLCPPEVQVEIGWDEDASRVAR